MSLLERKRTAFNTIHSFRTLLDSYPRMSTSDLLPSISNEPSQLGFTIDLFRVFGGTDQLKSTLSDIIVNHLSDFEFRIKDILKRQIRENIACNINPSVIDQLRAGGVFIPLKTVDMFNLMRKNPTGADGRNFYFDNERGINSNDFNVFLWNIVNTTQVQPWRPTQPIANVTFHETHSGGGNMLNVEIHSNYSANTITQFNSDFIDSIQFFDEQQVIAQIFGRVFGSLDLSINRTQEEILLEQKITLIIDRLSNCGDDSETAVDDSYFSFSHDNLTTMLRQAELRRSGSFLYSEDEGLVSSVTSEDILNALVDFQNAELVERVDVFTRTVDSLSDKVLENNPTISTVDRFNFRINIIKQLITELSALLTLTIMSPKIYLLILLNLRLLGEQINQNPIEFIKNNINLISGIVSEVKDLVMDRLVAEILNMARDLALNMGSLVVREQNTKFRKLLDSFRNLPINILEVRM